MKKLMPVLLLALLVLSGCARHYVITLNTGAQIGTTSKPRLKQGAYVYKDAMGQDASTPAGRVVEIAPASMARDKSSQSYSSPSK